MRKLNGRKIRWIVREIEKGELSICRIARLQRITPQHARRVYRKYKGVMHPKLLPCGRKLKPVTHEEVEIILGVRMEHPVCAVSLEKLLDSRGIHIPHNRIHRVLLQHGYARSEPKKQKRRRPWIRYERRHSNSLWHADWFERDEKQIILFEDDASRLLTGFSSFSNATARNAMRVLEGAIEEYGCPRQVITDHGAQFTSLPRGSCPDPRPNEFQRFLRMMGIKQIKARVKHPQSNGKVERLFQTLEGLKAHFRCWEDAVDYYNYERPHMSLENEGLRTPYQAFLDKTRES
jgi:putative transposase